MSDDEDSLFGSPPPSPHVGRPASPILALPRSSGSGSRPSTSTAPLTHNVGTIALPGSHPDSELPMNPLALSLNHGIVQWPPAQPQPQAAASPYMSYTPSASSAPSACSTRASTPRLGPPKKTTKKRRKESPPPPKPTGPEFVLPDPSEPPPAHFLRNQENLLGRAGRVAGVKPAAITHTRGASSSNPILIEDDEPDTPIIGRRARERTRERSSQPYIDPALLTAPTNQEIVQVLIGQKDIFPILEGVLKLVMGSTPGGSTSRHTPPQPTPTLPMRTGFERRHPSAPALPTYNYTTKKRKLSRVPAGAGDWDVPYPFEAGDGPKAYHNTWERERGKRLISELIKLIKNAARKAATKKYLQEQEARKREQEEPSLESSPFGTASTFPPWLVSKPQSGTVLQDASNSIASRAPDPTPSTSTPTTSSETCTSFQTPDTSDTAFNQLMASLNGAIPNEQQTAVNPLYVSQQQDKTDGVSGVDQPIFDTWMSFLETLPMSFNGTPSTSTAGDQSSQCSTPGITDFNFGSMSGLDASAGNLSFAQASDEYDAMIASIFNAPPAAVAERTPAAGPIIPPPPFDDSLIDPSLMDLSIQSSAFPSTMTANIDFSSMMDLNSTVAMAQSQAHLQVQAQVPSPVASTSSMGNNDPSTPASVIWDLSTPDVYMGGSGGEAGAEGHGETDGGFSAGDLAGMWRSTMWDYNTGIAHHHHGATTDWSSGATAGFVSDFGETVRRVDKGKQRAVEPSMTPTPISGITPIASSSSAAAGASATTTASSSTSASSSSTPLPLGEIPIPPTESIISTLLQTPAGTPGLSAALSGTSLFVPKPVPPPRHLRRDDVVKRAQERRARVQQELDAVKTRLWETTVEQAGMMTLMRRLDEAEAQARKDAVGVSGV